MHLPTLIVVTLALNSMVCAYMLILYRLRKEHGCFSYWGISCLVFVLGGALAASRELNVPIVLSVLVADLLLALAPAFLVLGLLRFFAVEVSRGQERFALTLAIAYLLLMLLFYEHSYCAGVLTASVVMLCFMTSAYLVYKHLLTMPWLRFLMQQVFMLHACLMAVEVVMLVNNWDNGHPVELPENLFYILLSHIFLTTLTALLLPLMSFLRHEADLKASAEQDPLTHLSNRRHFFSSAEAYWRSRPLVEPVSVMMIDVDHFKQVNDRYGHAVGDLALARVARVFQKHLRSTDLVGRIGGEEFAILLPGTLPEQAQLIAERLLLSVRQESAEFMPRGGRLTVSIGLVNFKGPSMDFKSVLDAADKALFQAKDTGRDRLALAAVDS